MQIKKKEFLWCQVYSSAEQQNRQQYQQQIHWLISMYVKTLYVKRKSVQSQFVISRNTAIFLQNKNFLHFKINLSSSYAQVFSNSSNFHPIIFECYRVQYFPLPRILKLINLSESAICNVHGLRKIIKTPFWYYCELNKTTWCVIKLKLFNRLL